MPAATRSATVQTLIHDHLTAHPRALLTAFEIARVTRTGITSTRAALARLEDAGLVEAVTTRDTSSPTGTRTHYRATGGTQ